MYDTFIPAKLSQKSIQNVRGRVLRVLTSFRQQELNHLKYEDSEGYYYSPSLELIADLRAEVSGWKNRQLLLDWLNESGGEDLGMRMYQATAEGGDYGDTDHSDAFQSEIMMAVFDKTYEEYYEMVRELEEDSNEAD